MKQNEKTTAINATNLSSTALLGLGYIFAPLIALKFFSLTLLLSYFLKTIKSARLATFFVLFSTVLYTLAFILNPIHFFYQTPNEPHFNATFFYGEGAALLCGIFWLILIHSQVHPFRIYKLLPSFPVICCWILGLLFLYLPSWKADLAYLGDEVFHFVAVQQYWFLLKQLFSDSLSRLFLGSWIVFAALLFHKPKQSKKLLFGVSISLLFLSLTSVIWVYSEEFIQALSIQSRVARYPTSQPWISAFLGAICVENWGEKIIFSNEMSRLLPLLSLFLLGLLFASDRRLKFSHPGVLVLALGCLASVPTLLFHGTILYLELPVLLFTTLILFDSKKFLQASPKQLSHRLSWWALVLLGFTKEMALPILFFLLLLRTLIQWKKRETFLSFFKQELFLWSCTLIPLFVYLTLRVYFQHRPYAKEFSNFLSLNLWGKNAFHLGYQFGFLWLFVFYGIFTLIQQKHWEKLVSCLFVFLGLQLFILGDYAHHVGLARFNLFLLPPILVLGWEGMVGGIQKSKRFGFLFLALLLFSNLLLSPVDFSGNRGDWGRSDERWYPYQQAMKEIKATNYEATILLANMPVPYGIQIVNLKLNWFPRAIYQLKPLSEKSTENVKLSLKYAASPPRVPVKNFSYQLVVYRSEEKLKNLEIGTKIMRYQLWKRYPAKIGFLYVFRKTK